jgi:hypothetical protein
MLSIPEDNATVTLSSAFLRMLIKNFIRSTILFVRPKSNKKAPIQEEDWGFNNYYEYIL